MKKIYYQEWGINSPKYWSILCFLGAIIGVAGLATLHMEHEGHWVTGMTNQVVWGLPHVFAIFLIVAASGALNVASNGAPQNSLDTQPAYKSNLAIKADGNLTVAGDSKTANALLISGGSSVDTIHVIGDMFVSGAVDCGNKGKLADRFAVADSKPKPFDLKHPTKGEGHRLRYACIEGPEVGVYYRGRLKGKNIIELPYYWKDLVHEDSITVQLQPIGKNQNLVIESFNSEYVVIEIGANQDFLTNEILIDCFYHVYAERKDVNPLVVEYDGETWQDYPDPDYNDSAYAR